MHSAAELLYTGMFQVGETPCDLLGQADSAQPTFVNCRAYRVLLWTGVKTGNAPIEYAVRGGDQYGWQWTHMGVVSTSAQQWFRLVIKMPRRTAWLRIEVFGAAQKLQSTIVGVRG